MCIRDSYVTVWVIVVNLVVRCRGGVGVPIVARVDPAFVLPVEDVYKRQEDPESNYGAGIRAVSDRLKATGHTRVQVLLYPGAR